MTGAPTLQDYALVVDRDNDGDFSNAELITTDMSYDGTHIWFDNVDFGDGNYFALVTGTDDNNGVTLEQASTQDDPTPVDSATFTVSFETQIDPATFDVSDIVIAGTT